MFSQYDDEIRSAGRSRLECLLDMLQGDDPILHEAAQLIERRLVERERPSQATWLRKIA